jgi:phage terminase small subunit
MPGLVTPLDRAALAAYCCSFSTWAQAEQIIREEGMTVTTPRGQEVRFRRRGQTGVEIGSG